MTYGNVYVAQVASGANQMQTIKAFEEAERFPPSLIIAYTPCITHGLFGGMRQSIKEAQEAVASGYWSLYRYNPEAREKGKLPMTLDYKKPDFEQMPAFMRTQVRFASLETNDKELSDKLFAKTVDDAKIRFYNYARLAGQEEKIRGKLEKMIWSQSLKLALDEKKSLILKRKRDGSPKSSPCGTKRINLIP